jgi:hypothetical protein
VCSHHQLKDNAPDDVLNLDLQQLEVGKHINDALMKLESKTHTYTFKNVEYPSLSSGLDGLFRTFSEFKAWLLGIVPWRRRRALNASLCASGPMGTRVHAYLAHALLQLAQSPHPNDAPKSVCTHPAFGAMVEAIKQQIVEGWELFRVEVSMVSEARRVAGTPDVVMRRRVKPLSAEDTVNCWEYMIVDHKLSSSASKSLKGDDLFKKDRFIQDKAAALVAQGHVADLSVATALARKYYLGDLKETVFCKRTAQLVGYMTLGVEGSYFPLMRKPHRVRMVVLVGHPKLA